MLNYNVLNWLVQCVTAKKTFGAIKKATDYRLNDVFDLLTVQTFLQHLNRQHNKYEIQNNETK